jgi:hypothetical protein
MLRYLRFHIKSPFLCSTKPHVYQKFEIFWTNIASTMASPNSKNGPKNGPRPLGVNYLSTNNSFLHVFLLCQEHDPCYLYLGSINTRMGVFIGCGYGSEPEIAASTLPNKTCSFPAHLVQHHWLCVALTHST